MSFLTVGGEREVFKRLHSHYQNIKFNQLFKEIKQHVLLNENDRFLVLKNCRRFDFRLSVLQLHNGAIEQKR